LAVQLEKLKACDKIFKEKRSGVDAGRPELKACLDYLREGDTLLVTKLDRLARSTPRQQEGINKAKAEGVRFGPKPLLTEHVVEKIKQLRAEGLTVPEIMRRTKSFQGIRLPGSRITELNCKPRGPFVGAFSLLMTAKKKPGSQGCGAGRRRLRGYRRSPWRLLGGPRAAP
jgi:hypothetical protein